MVIVHLGNLCLICSVNDESNKILKELSYKLYEDNLNYSMSLGKVNVN